MKKASVLENKLNYYDDIGNMNSNFVLHMYVSVFLCEEIFCMYVIKPCRLCAYHLYHHCRSIS